MNKQDVKLRPCPFKHAAREGVYAANNNGEDFGGHSFIPRSWVVCEDCYARGPELPTEDEAIAAWNTRPVEDALVEALLKYRHGIGHKRCSFHNMDDHRCLDCKATDAALRGAEVLE